MEGSTLKLECSIQKTVFVSCRLESQGKAPLFLPETPSIVRDTVGGGNCARIQVSLGSLPCSFFPKSELLRLTSCNEWVLVFSASLGRIL